MPNLLAETLRRSKEITLKRYEIPTFDSNAYSKVMLRTCSRLAPDAERVFAALFEWRDRVARVGREYRLRTFEWPWRNLQSTCRSTWEMS